MIAAARAGGDGGAGPVPTPPPSSVAPDRATTPDLTTPVDDIHDMSLAAVRIIRQSFADAAARAKRWEPQPWDPDITDAASRLGRWVRP